ncbi:MAG: cupredoxin domain-containing protein [Nitrososphaerales archaeon]
MVDWELMVPGMGLTILGMAGVGLSLAGIARTFLEGMHAIAALMMFIGMILLATGILKDGLPSSNTAKATVIILVGFLVMFGTIMIGMSEVGSLSIFAGILLLILIPSIVIAYAAHKQSAHFKAISLLFSGASAVGVITFAIFGMVAPQPIEAGVLEQPEQPEVPEVTGPKVEITILEGSSIEGAPAYDPTEITVEKGSTIVWTNDDSVVHTVTSGGVEDPNFGLFFDSLTIKVEDTFSLDTSKLELGEYQYFCTFHPYMRGTFTVLEQGEAALVEQEPATKVEVTILKGSALPQNKAFDPTETTVQKGTLVIWTNNDDVLHTVTSGVADDPDSWSNIFDSGILNEGESFKLNTSKLEPGEYPYLCTLHPFMLAKLIVTE